MLIDWTGLIACCLLLTLYIAKHTADRIPERGLAWLRLRWLRAVLSACILRVFIVIVKGTQIRSLGRVGVFLADWVSGRR